MDFEIYVDVLLCWLFYEEKVEVVVFFSVIDFNGNIYFLEELKGKVVVFNFWFIGCVFCWIEIFGFNDMLKYYDKEEVIFIVFVLDGKEEFKKFLVEFLFDY